MKRKKETEKKSTEAPKESEVTSITELERLTKEASEFKDKYFRALADAENQQKRLQKEKVVFAGFAKEEVLRNLLDPIDQFSNALGHAENASDDIRNWAMGFKMILGQFEEALASSAVAPFDSVGKTFDPERHEALEMVETDEHAPGTIVHEYKRGYLVGDRLLRPAQVKVAKAKNSDKQENQENVDNKEKAHDGQN